MISDTCVHSCTNHLERGYDCLIVYFKYSKGDQNWVNKTEHYYIYANPLCPVIFPFLSLGKYMFTNLLLLKGDC